MAKPSNKGCRGPSSATRFLPDLEEEPLCSRLPQLPRGKTPRCSFPKERLASPGGGEAIPARSHPPSPRSPWISSHHGPQSSTTSWLGFFFSRNRCTKLALGRCQDVSAQGWSRSSRTLLRKMSSPEPISQRLLQTQPPPPLLPVSHSHTHLAAARFSMSLFSCLKKPANRARAPGTQGEGVPVHAPRRGNAVGQLELCHGTTAKLSRAGSSRYGHIGNLGSLSASQLLRGCVCIQNLGVNRRPVPEVPQTFSLVRLVLTAKNLHKPTWERQERKKHPVRSCLSR